MTQSFLDKIMKTAKNKSNAIKQRAKTLKPTNPTNRYVILPGWRKGEEDVFFHDFGQHYVKNLAGELQVIYPCVDKTYNKACSVCQAISQSAVGVVDEEQLKVLKDASSGQSYLLNVLALDSDDPKTPQILEIRKSAFGQILELLDDWAPAIFDPENPIVVKINREGKGLNTKYTVAPTMTKESINAADLYSKLNNLDEYVQQENEETMQRAIGAVKNVVGLLPASASATTAKQLTSPQEIEATAVSREAEISRAAEAQFVTTDAELDDILGGLDDISAA